MIGYSAGGEQISGEEEKEGEGPSKTKKKGGGA